MAARTLFTSESVFPGHPDKVADQIADGILDAMLVDDPASRVACETLVTTGLVLVAGEVTTKSQVNIQDRTRKTIEEIGYGDPELGFDHHSCAVLVALHGQSPDISQGVTETAGHEQGAGDQGMMFGYACNQTRELMPAPIQMAKAISVRAVEAREKGILPYLRPDGKCQVTVEYDGRKPVRVHTVVVSLQHSPAMNDKQGQLRQDVIERIVKPVVPAQWLDRRTIHHVNPTGRFEVGGPHGDTGLTGRKIVVDTYGGYAPHGGGAFSGKDPSKVDRSAALMGRYVAKNVVAAGLADECQIQVAYAIGVAEPVSLLVDTRGTAKVSEEKLSQAIRELCSFKPKAIIERFQLRRPIYRLTAGLGPFGRELPEFLWEKTDLAAELKAAVK